MRQEKLNLINIWIWSFEKTQPAENIQYIKDLSFENPNSPKSLTDNKEPPDIKVDINVFAKPFDKKVYEVCLSIGGKAKKKSRYN